MPRGRFFFGPGFWKWGRWPYWAGWRHFYCMGPWAWRPGWWAPWWHFHGWGLGDLSPKDEVEFLKEHGASEERLRPFTQGVPHVGVQPETALWAFQDDRGRWVAFPTQEQAQAHALSIDGASSRPVSHTTFGDLLARDPRALVQAHGQYYWAEDLV